LFSQLAGYKLSNSSFTYGPTGMLDVSGMLYIQPSTQYDFQTLFYYFGHQTEHYTELFEQNYITFHYLSIQQLHHINQYVRPNSPNTLLSVCLKNKYQT
jgi:hypothetical protein